MGGYIFVCVAVVINVECHTWRFLLFIIKKHQLFYHLTTIQPFLCYPCCWRQCVYLLELKRRIEGSKITNHPSWPAGDTFSNAAQRAVGFCHTGALLAHGQLVLHLDSHILLCSKTDFQTVLVHRLLLPRWRALDFLSLNFWQPSLPISAASWGPQWQHDHCYLDISSSPQLCIICQFAQS